MLIPEFPMTVATSIPKLQPTDRPLQRGPTWRCTVPAYVQMLELGIVEPDLRTELLNGRILVVPPPSPPHASVTDRLAEHFILGLQRRAIVRVQGGIPLDPWSFPAPDLAILRRSADHYLQRHPTPEECLLFVEVAASSLRRDRRLKLPLYARAGIPETWIIDLGSGQVELYSAPAEGRYTICRVMREADTVAPAAFPDLGIQVGELLGRAG